MNSDRRPGGFLVGLTALAALIVALLPKPSAGPEASKPDKDKGTSLLDAAPTDDASSYGPLAPVWDYLGSGSDCPTQGTTPKSGTWSKAKRYSLGMTEEGAFRVTEEAFKPNNEAQFYKWPDDLSQCNIRFLIATVPDPIESGFPFMFDQIVESLQRALEQGDYVFDRAWLPWQRVGPDKSADPRRGEQHPGLILFRSTAAGDPGRHHLLALLLVGETPTSGIHKGAFHQAVQIVCQCKAAKENEDDHVAVRVIGPYFSGSAVSLRMALEEARKVLLDHGRADQEPLIKVVCGSASGFDHDEFIKSEWVGPDLTKKAAFQTTILSDDVILKCVLKYFGDPGASDGGEPPKPICLLVESNTGFGQSVASKVTHKDKSPKPKDKSPKPSAKVVNESPGTPAYFVVPYPLHISQLRSSYTKEQLARLENQGLPHAGRNLPFPYEGGDKEGKGREAIEPESPLMTAAINDLVLDNLVTTLAQKRAQHICLVSSDPQDIIFLARLIRDRYPDVQLATVGSDLLFTHEDYNSALRGMVVASTYPLYLSAQKWSEVKEPNAKGTSLRILFADQSFEGYYNAALVHLAEGACEEVRPRIWERMLDYGWEGKDEEDLNTYPPIWISVVGANGQMIPVRYVSPKQYLKADSKALDNVFPRPNDNDNDNGSDKAMPNLDHQRPPSLSFLLFVVLLVASAYCFWLAWYYLQASPWGSGLEDIFSRYKQRIDFGVVCLAQVILFGRLAEWGWAPLRANSLSGGFREVLVNLGLLGVVVLSLIMMGGTWVYLLRAYAQEKLNDEGRLWPRLKQRWERFKLIWRENPLWVFGEPQKKEGIQGYLQGGGAWIGLADLTMFLLVTGTVIWFSVLNIRALIHPIDVQEVITYDRLAHLSNGVSSLLPLVFICAAFFGWGVCQVKKLFLASHHAVEPPFPKENASSIFVNLHRLDGQVRAELVPPSTLRIHPWKCAAVFGLTALGFLTLWEDSIPPLDGWWFGLIMLVGFGLGAFLLLFTLLQFYSAWRALRKMLHFLTLLPMQAAFGRLNEKVLALFGHYLFSRRPRHSHLAVSVQQFELLRRLFPAFRKAIESGGRWQESHPPLDAATLTNVWTEVQKSLDRGQFDPPIREDFAGELNAPDEKDDEPPPTATTDQGAENAPNEPPPIAATDQGAENAAVKDWGAKTGEDCRDLAERCLRVLWRLWPAQTLEGAFGEPSQPSQPTPQFLSLKEDDPIRQWAVAAEDFVAAEILRYLSQFTAQLRTLLNSLTIGSLLLLLAATVYPFFPQQQLLLGLTLLGGLVAAGIAVFLIQLNRDELVSRITQSTPNRFTPDLAFLQGAVTYVLPIIAAVTIQFPFVTSSLRSLFNPLFHIIK